MPFKGFGKGVAALGRHFTGLGDKVSNSSGTLRHGFRVLLRYGFGIRSLYVLFRRLRKAITESFTELQKSGAMWQTTKANVEGLKTALSTLKFQFGAAFEPLFNVVAPALTKFINYLISLMNTISAFIAKLTGRSTYSKVAQVMNNTAGSAGSAAKATKELNKQLQSFDELNNITPENDSNGGGGGGGGGGGTGAVYTEESVESALGDFANALIDNIKKGDWKAVGKMIGDKLTEAMNSIKWEKVFDKARNFGKNLAEFLNGLISPELFDALGTTIGNAIRTKLEFLNSLGQTLDWDNIADSISTGISSFVKTHPLVLAAETFNTWATKITGSLARAINNLLDDGTIQTISDDITKALQKINIGEIGWNVGQIVSGLANSIYVLVSNEETWAELGNKIGDGIGNFFTSMNKKNGATGKTGWEALGGSISKTIHGIVTALKKALETVSWEEVGQAIVDFIGSIKWGELIWDLATLALEVLGALCEAIKGYLDDATWQEKVGLVIVGMIAVAKLPGISGIISTLLTKHLGDKTVSAKVGGLALTIGGAWLMGVNKDDGTAKSLAENAFWDMAGAAGIVVGAKKLGFSTGIALKIGIIALAIELGIDVGSYIGQQWADLMADEGLISREGADEYIEISKNRGPLGIKWWIDIGKSIFETTSDGKNRFAEAWTEMWTDWFTPVFDEFADFGRKLAPKITDLANFTVNAIEGGKTIVGYAWKKFFSLEDDIDKAMADNYARFKLGFDDFIEKVKRAIVQAKSGVQFQDDVHYEYDDNGGIRYAYKDSKKLGAYNIQLEYDLALKLNKGEITIDEFERLKLIIEALRKLANFKNTININTNIDGDMNSVEDVDGASDSFNKLGGSLIDANATYSASVGGQLQVPSDINKWTDSFKNLRNNWKDASATMKASVGGQIKAISELDTWKNYIHNLQTQWNQTTTATFNTKADTTAASDGLKSLGELSKSWKGTGTTAKFTAEFNNASTDAQGYKDFCTLYDNWYGPDPAVFSVEFSVSGLPNIQNAFDRLTENLNAALKNAGVKAVVSSPALNKAKGGVATSPTMAVWGEAGAEALVPLENNLGWLNKMSDMMIEGMENSTKLKYTASPSMPSFTTDSGSYSVESNDLIAEQTRLIQQQNDLLEQILDKPTGISSRDVFQAVRSESTDFFNRTGRGAFAY